MATNALNITITQTGAQGVSSSIHAIGQSATAASQSINILNRALGFLTAVLAIDKIAKYADEWNRAAGAINIATKSTYQAAQVTDQLFEAAQRTRAGFNDLVDIYSRVARAGKSLGASQQDIINFTEGIGKALAVQGTTSTQAKGALLQLGQAMNNGTVRAEEFNSVLEGAPVILQTVADNVKGAGGDIGKLRQIMLASGLSSRGFFESFLKGSADLEAKFQQTEITIGQGFLLIENAMTRFIGKLDDSIGASQKIGEVAKFIAKNFELIGTAALALSAIIVTAFAPAIIIQFGSALKTLFTLMAANQFIALAAGIAAAVVILNQYGDQISANAEGTASLNDVLRATGEVAVEVFDTFVSAVELGLKALGELSDYQKNTLHPSFVESAEGGTSAYKSFFDNTGTGFIGFARSVARVIDAISGLLIGLGILIYRVFSGLPDLIEGTFKEGYSIAARGIEKITNAAIDASNQLRGAIGMSVIAPVKIEHEEADKNRFKNYGESLRSSFDEGFSVLDGVFEKKVNSIEESAKEFQKERKERERLAEIERLKAKASLGDPLGAGSPAIAKDSSAKEIKKLENALRALLNTIDPISGALLEVAKAQKILSDAERLGMITHAQHIEYLAALNKHYADIIDPMRVVNRQFEEEAQLLNMNAKARAAEIEVRKIRDDLIEKGRPASERELTTLRETITAQQEYTKMIEAQDGMLAESVGKREDFTRQLEAFKNVQQNPNFTSGDAAIKKADLLSSLGIDIAGTQTAAEAQLAVMQQYYANIDQLVKDEVISVETAEAQKAKARLLYQQIELNQADQFFGNLATLSQSKNKELATIGKAAAITQATIQGIVAVQNALAVQPYYLGVALAVSAGIAAAANVAKIAGVGFATGGQFTVGGSGGTDSQTVAFRATPGEQVRVNTPQQIKKGGENQQGQGSSDGSGSNNGIRIVNVLDPSIVGDFLSSSQGEKTLVNVLQKNPQIIQNIARQG